MLIHITTATTVLRTKLSPCFHNNSHHDPQTYASVLHPKFGVKYAWWRNLYAQKQFALLLILQ